MNAQPLFSIGDFSASVNFKNYSSFCNTISASAIIYLHYAREYERVQSIFPIDDKVKEFIDDLLEGFLGETPGITPDEFPQEERELKAPPIRVCCDMSGDCPIKECIEERGIPKQISSLYEIDFCRINMFLDDGTEVIYHEIDSNNFIDTPFGIKIYPFEQVISQSFNRYNIVLKYKEKATIFTAKYVSIL